MKQKVENLGIINGNEILSNCRVNLNNKTVPYKNKKKYNNKYKCRKKILKNKINIDVR